MATSNTKTGAKKKTARRISLKRPPVKKVVKDARKRARDAGKRAKDLVKRARKRIQSVNADSTRRRAAQLTVGVIDFQKAAFDNTIDFIGKLQEQTGKMLHEAVDNLSWVPGEGKEVVDEWIKTVNKGRKDFKHSTDKSFDLISKFVKRIEREQSAKKPTAKKAAKKKAAKKKTASKKTATRKKAPAKKAGPKKATAKRTARKRS
ncbi:MAG: hypothetical protein IID08_08115 [Candidatus Hydrogenedentes bacterium]|nr:hypothetical protein [Candidatus Hydrogenedentota bacterium]